MLAHIVPGVTLNGTGDDFLGLAVRSLAGLGLDEAHHLGGLMASAGLDLGKKPLASFLGGQAGNLLQAAFLFGDVFVEAFFKFGEPALFLGEVLLDAEQLVFLLGRLFELFLKALALLLQFAVARLQFPLALLELVLKLALLVEKLVLPLKEDFLFLGLRFLAGFFDYAGGKLGGVADPFGVEMLVEIEAYAPADAYGREDAECGKNFHKSPPFIVSGTRPFMRCGGTLRTVGIVRTGEDILMGKGGRQHDPRRKRNANRLLRGRREGRQR